VQLLARLPPWHGPAGGRGPASGHRKSAGLP